jgi:hypothetical protein
MQCQAVDEAACTRPSLKKYKIFIRNSQTRLTLPVGHGIMNYVALALEA